MLLRADAAALPDDAARSLQRACQAGARIETALPERLEADLLIDALLGLGARRAPEGAVAAAIGRTALHRGPLLAVDLPSGLHAETGAPLGETVVRATDTLSLLALKPGLFTGQGRELCGRLWHDDIGVDEPQRALQAPLARLAPTLAGAGSLLRRQHAQHKGSFGDVVVIGGAPGMAGAARLAGRAALAAGAGRIYLSLLDPEAAGDDGRPELMHRPAAWSDTAGLLTAATVVCGCGGGQAVAALLPPVLEHVPRLVLDADALNAIAADATLQQALAARARRGQHTVLTPHPLEAARLLGCSAAQVQADRLNAALQIAARLQVVVVLKGSGTVLAAPARLPMINATGNALLATAGTGDVLAGWLGGRWAPTPGEDGWLPALDSVRLHGAAADAAAAAGRRGPLRAAELVEAMLALG
nr:NAD(P)H-hydrate dehydratase [Aquincola sp. J276]